MEFIAYTFPLFHQSSISLQSQIHDVNMIFYKPRSLQIFCHLSLLTLSSYRNVQPVSFFSQNNHVIINSKNSSYIYSIYYQSSIINHFSLSYLSRTFSLELFPLHLHFVKLEFRYETFDHLYIHGRPQDKRSPTHCYRISAAKRSFDFFSAIERIKVYR